MRILVSEITSHQKNLPHLFKLFSGKFDTRIYIHTKEKGSISNIPTDKIHISRFPKSLFYWYLCIKAPSYKYIFLSTGPEYTKGFFGVVATLGFYLLSVLFPSKVILHIRNTNNYLPEKNFFSGAIIQKLRIKATNHIKRFTFDSLLTLDYFKSKYQHSNSVHLSIIAINYSDIRFLKQLDSNKSTDIIRIGLIGKIDVYRKDYNLIFNLLQKLEHLSKRFEFVILGECKDSKSQQIISRIQESSNVIYSLKYLSDNEFEELGLSCHILFAPLTNNYGYGLTKETGAFGDAIYLHKKVIIPQFACNNGEFDPISIYYDTDESLVSIFKQIALTTDKSSFKVDPTYLDKYSTTSIFNQISIDLKL